MTESRDLAAPDSGADRSLPRRGRLRGRGLARIDSHPAEMPTEYWQQMLMGRWVLSVLLFAVIAAVPMFGPHRVWIATAFAGLTGCHNLMLGRSIKRTGRLPWAMPAVDHVLVVVLGLLIPTSLMWGIVVNATGLPVTVMNHGRRAAIRLWAASIPAYCLAGWWTHAPQWPIALALFIVAGLGNYSLMGDAADEERRLRDRYSDLLDQLQVVVFESSGVGEPLTYVNDHVGKMLGSTRDQWLDQQWWRSRLHPDDQGAFEELYDAARNGGTHQNTYRMIAEDGRVLHVLEITRVSTSEAGNTNVRGVLVDITRQAEAEAEASQLGMFVDQIPIALQIMEIADPDDIDGIRMVAANQLACENAGTSLDRLTAEWPRRHAVVGSDRANLEAIAEVRRTGVPLTDRQWDWIDQTGTRRRVAIEAFPLGGNYIGVSYVDITTRADAEQALRYQANHDALTGLASRALVAEQLDDALGRCATDGGHGTFLMMDLDQFKEVNDALGHHHGDRLLIELGGRLREIAGENLAARLGGDEFALLLENTTARDALAVAADIRRAFAEPIVIDGVRLQTNVSVGIAVYPEHATDADALMQRADAAMYRAKHGGTGVALFTPEQSASGMRRLQLLGDLRNAIDRAELMLHYQPRLDLTTGDLDGVEALVRWNHPTLGMLPPDEFIRLAEVSGLIQPMTQFVIRCAVADAARLEALGHALPFAVNLSVRNLYSPDLIESIESALERERLAPRLLRMELTESEIMDDPSAAMEMLHRLRSRGIEVSIDDFGTGYSSLSYLRDLPIDEIKIDRSFVAAISGGDDVVVRSIIDLGHALGVSVVGEGVETVEQFDHLQRLGCDVVQGYLIGRPMPYDDLQRFVTDRAEFADSGSASIARWERGVTHG